MVNSDVVEVPLGRGHPIRCNLRLHVLRGTGISCLYQIHVNILLNVSSHQP
eukprot:UN14434